MNQIVYHTVMLQGFHSYFLLGIDPFLNGYYQCQVYCLYNSIYINYATCRFKRTHCDSTTNTCFHSQFWTFSIFYSCVVILLLFSVLDRYVSDDLKIHANLIRVQWILMEYWKCISLRNIIAGVIWCGR